MHIAIDARVINSSTGTYVVKLLEYLQQIDHDNQYSVLVPTKDRDYWQPSVANFAVRTIDFPNYSLAEQTGFKNYLEELSPDLVHFCMPQQPIFYGGRRVTTVHDLTLLKTYNSDKNWLVFHLKQLVGRFVFHRVAKVSDHIIAISENTKRELQEFTKVPDDKVSVIYESGEVHKGELEPHDVPFDKFIMYVGQQPDYKNIPRLMDAHQKLLETHPDLGLILVGRINKATQRNKDYAEKNNYRNIHFTDFIPDSQRDWLYTKAQAYVFPSMMEGFGLPPLEAMAYGTPVISSNASCMPEILGYAPIYFDPLSVDSIHDAISKVIDDEDLRASMSKKGYAQVAKYSWERMAKATHAVYMDVLSK